MHQKWHKLTRPVKESGTAKMLLFCLLFSGPLCLEVYRDNKTYMYTVNAHANLLCKILPSIFFLLPDLFHFLHKL